ncbi:type II secretion system protein [Psychromonas antarctica]|uniref:type II secretion system protein n=1 Tax=Psychromonas antarctica TaxID=67573 RepID=UPI001EE78255|nr:type II secretion system protein [Psychromonas antarctica]MCG6199694.1 type II secretion system GspH family protein [Psychromonas antarctica]
MRLLLANKKLTQQAGFTFIELVIVIIVLGILSVTVIPKLTSKSGFEDYTVRDQLIARLRLVQLQGMNADPTDGLADNRCYWLVVKDSCFYHEQTARNANSCVTPVSNYCSDESYNRYNSVTFPKGMLTPAEYRFNIKNGTLSSDSAVSPIRLYGDNGLCVEIESEGYIHGEQNCD